MGLYHAIKPHQQAGKFPQHKAFPKKIAECIPTTRSAGRNHPNADHC